MNVLLTQYPTLALKRDHITDHSGRHFYWSPLEAAHWSGNWVLRDLILQHAQSIPDKSGQQSGKMRAAEQLHEWDQQSYNYNLLLMRAKEGPFTILETTPALIKQSNEQGEEKIFQWGEVNGEWMLTDLDKNTTKAFKHLDFPKSSNDKIIVITSDQITTDMYDALKKAHNPAHFDLEEYCRVTDAFVKKYPAHLSVPQAQKEEWYDDKCRIGRSQVKFPAWLAAVWCSPVPFHPLPDCKNIVLAPESCWLRLYGGGVNHNFNPLIGAPVIYKGGRRASVVLVSNNELESWMRDGGPAIDLVAMAAVCKVITEENDKSKQLLPGVSKSPPGFSG